MKIKYSPIKVSSSLLMNIQNTQNKEKRKSCMALHRHWEQLIKLSNYSLPKQCFAKLMPLIH